MESLRPQLPVDKTTARATTATVELAPPAVVGVGVEGEVATTTDLLLQAHTTTPMIDGTAHDTINSSSSTIRGGKTTAHPLPKTMEVALLRKVIMDGLRLQTGPLLHPLRREIPTIERHSGDSSVPSTKIEAASYQKLNCEPPW
jgi:hypothetical protein